MTFSLVHILEWSAIKTLNIIPIVIMTLSVMISIQILTVVNIIQRDST
jgi:hypothetical protein